eukprot:jgi/Pico_ML_1/56065/g1660.t1
MGAGGGGTTSAGLIENGANDGMVDIVDGAMDEEPRHVATTPISSPGENSLQIVARPKGRVWTNAHNKAMLDVLREEDCCFLVKRTNGDKGVAWKLFVERLKGAYPKLFGSWDLDRKQERRDALDEWRLRDEAHRNDPFRHADPGSLDDWIRERFVTRGQGTSMHTGPSATQQEDEEVESPLKEGRDASYM